MSIETSTIESQTNLPPLSAGEDVVFYPETDGEPMAETDIHRELMNHFIEALKIYFQNDENVYVTGNLLLYFEEGNPKKSVASDVMICFGAEKKLRRIYKLWEEKQTPQVVFEISSTSTWREDLSRKYSLYEKLGVKEYYIYDPEYKALDEPLLAYHLIEGEFVKADVGKKRIFSPTLHLEIVDTGEDLRLFNPNTKEFLMTTEEMAAKLKELENKK